MKKKLHPNLEPIFDHGQYDSLKFRGGALNLFDIMLEFIYDKKEESWQIVNPNIISDEDMVNFLNKLYEVAPDQFSDESEVPFSEISKDRGAHFWDSGGKCWLQTSEPGVCVSVIKQSDGSFHCIGDIKSFDDHEVVYLDALVSKFKAE